MKLLIFDSSGVWKDRTGTLDTVTVNAEGHIRIGKWCGKIVGGRVKTPHFEDGTYPVSVVRTNGKTVAVESVCVENGKATAVGVTDDVVVAAIESALLLFNRVNELSDKIEEINKKIGGIALF